MLADGVVKATVRLLPLRGRRATHGAIGMLLRRIPLPQALGVKDVATRGLQASRGHATRARTSVNHIVVANPADLALNLANLALHLVYCWGDLSNQQQPLSIFRGV